jgi:LacI family transcriptional regulator
MARRRQNVTIRDVALDAGVSLQTVSRVINDEPNVRPNMKARVQASIDKLGYVPSIAAQQMGGSSSRLILAINDRERTVAAWNDRQGNDWVDQMLMGGMLKCAELGYRLIFELVDTHNDHVQRELLASIAALQPDGIILTPPHSDNPLIVDLLEERGIPFARIGSHESSPGMAVSMDDEGAARLATRYLVDHGHRKIGFIAGSSAYNLSGWRIDGWKAAMLEAGCPTDGLMAQGDFSYPSGELAARQLLQTSDRPTAIIASNDQMALATLEVARSMGLSVPDELSVISFDNTPVVRFAHPPMTAIEQPIGATASKAVELIVASLKGDVSTDAISVISPSLVERRSVAQLRDTAGRP